MWMPFIYTLQYRLYHKRNSIPQITLCHVVGVWELTIQRPCPFHRQSLTSGWSGWLGGDPQLRRGQVRKVAIRPKQSLRLIVWMLQGKARNNSTPQDSPCRTMMGSATSG